MSEQQFDPTTTPVNPEVIQVNAPEAFYELVLEAIDNPDQRLAAASIEDFVAQTTVEFRDPELSDDDYTNLADQIEREVSSFIADNQATRVFELMGAVEYGQISATYNPNNMLAFAKELIDRAEAGLTQDDLDMIYRYRTIVKRLQEQAELFDAAQMAQDYNVENNVRHGYRTWAGDVRQYGHDNGRIDRDDYRSFDAKGDEHGDDPGRHDLVVDGVVIKFKVRNDHLSAGEGF